uniref:Uncharacterized protein n=1 Tax=Romanomermis culicivorax TaxID=13658 RepID=A0A915J853_ROMCU
MRGLFFCEAKPYSCIVDRKAIVDIAFVYYLVVLSSLFVSPHPHGPCKVQALGSTWQLSKKNLQCSRNH